MNPNMEKTAMAIACAIYFVVATAISFVVWELWRWLMPMIFESAPQWFINPRFLPFFMVFWICVFAMEFGIWWSNRK